MKKVLLPVLAAVFVFACLSPALAAPRIIKIGHTGTQDHHYQMYLETWAEKV